MNMHASISRSTRTANVRWGWLRSKFERARTAMAAYENATYRPATQRLVDLSGPIPPTRIPIYAKNGSAAVYTVWDANLYEGFNWFEPVREGRRAYDAYNEKVRLLEVETGWSAISDEMRRLDVIEGRARDALIAEPAPDFEAFAFKASVALEEDELDAEVREKLLADLTRLLPNGKNCQ